MSLKGVSSFRKQETPATDWFSTRVPFACRQQCHSLLTSGRHFHADARTVIRQRPSRALHLSPLARLGCNGACLEPGTRLSSCSVWLALPPPPSSEEAACTYIWEPRESIWEPPCELRITYSEPPIDDKECSIWGSVSIAWASGALATCVIVLRSSCVLRSGHPRSALGDLAYNYQFNTIYPRLE